MRDVLLYVAYISAGFAVLVGLVWFMHKLVKAALSSPAQSRQLAASISRTPVTPISSPVKVHPLPQVHPGLEDRSGVVALPSGLRVVHPPAPGELPDGAPSSSVVHKPDDRI